MFPPIRQCPEGHNFCNKCATKLMSGSAASARKCPSCRTPLSQPVARARNLEQWATETDVDVTCDHEECGESFPYSKYAEHKKTCIGCSIECPLRKCKHRCEPQHLTAHLMEDLAQHKLPTCPNAAKFSSRHRDYSTTVIFETTRRVGNTKRWRPPRQLVIVPPNPKLGTEGCTFVIALWKPKGDNEPFLATISALRKPGHDETPWSFDISLSAYPRPPTSLCVSRASMCGTVRDLDATEAWTRPVMAKCRAPVLVADAASMALFNTANLDPNGHELQAGQEREMTQRYELHVRLMPLTADAVQLQAQREGALRASAQAGDGAGAAHGMHAHGHPDDDDATYSSGEPSDVGEEEGESDSDSDDDLDDDLDDSDSEDDSSSLSSSLSSSYNDEMEEDSESDVGA